MAIITNIYHIHRFLNDHIVLEYFYSVCNEVHKNRLRILELPLKTCKKEYISKDFFSLEQNYMTKPRNKCFWESHKKYIDIQLHLKGIEQMEFADINYLEILEEYNEKKDLIIYKDNFCSNKVVMQKNDIAIFFPEDAHLGMTMYNENPSHILKTVIKYPLGLWK
ncbi:YhcH/YjgK/YiaL family protein [Campylobacter jejuni]|uniref:YhcH/YjgK/YiaL family protein n=1 Tax=Campylobacter jejuni TaxID=197 RepID=UPI000F80A4A3|nr:YhcH/YjgK/YiaL family protein [Campylobacter jejuni]RTI74153.1 YhcH/YjgK/YiaL family protein [Campylobacter jejuni]